MASQIEPLEPGQISPAPRVPTFALIGNPNTGKSSLFNALSGGNAAVGNYSGVTVDLKRSTIKHQNQQLELIDLPGTYSLTARSIDEQVSVDAISNGNPAIPTLDGIVVVLDATAIERNLYLVSQLMESGLPMLIVANMWDRVDKAGVKLDIDQLSERLGVPIITTCAAKRMGIDAVKDAILKLPEQLPAKVPAILPQIFDSALEELHRWFAQQDLPIQNFQARRLLLDCGMSLDDASLQKLSSAATVTPLREYLLQARLRMQQAALPLPAAEARLRYAWIGKLLQGVLTRSQPAPAIEDRIDQVLTHRWYGLVVFVLVMLAMFQLLYSDLTTGLLSGWIESGQTWLQNWVSESLQPGPLQSLINDGILAGIGAVLVFIPQIAVLFLMLAVLEDCGYMARVAMVMDRMMSSLGLNGKAFLPLMTSFGCAVPGILATRTIANRSDRLLTMLVAPLMSCSARLPVYILMTEVFVPDIALLGGWLRLQSVVLLSMLMLGAVVAVPIAWLIRKLFLPGKSSPFVLELPAYKWPSPRVVYIRVRDQVYEFLRRAGTLIFCTAVIVWALLYFPGDRSDIYQKMNKMRAAGDEVIASQLEQEIQIENAALVRQSILGRVGIAMEPVFRPLGWDWRIGVSVLASFPAREVVIATLGTIFALGGDNDEQSLPLRETLTAAQTDGHDLFNVPVALSIMVFFALCMQCGATLIVMKRESRTWRWPIFTFFYMTILAYLAAFFTYQISIRLMT